MNVIEDCVGTLCILCVVAQQSSTKEIYCNLPCVPHCEQGEHMIKCLTWLSSKYNLSVLAD